MAKAQFTLNLEHTSKENLLKEKQTVKMVFWLCLMVHYTVVNLEDLFSMEKVHLLLHWEQLIQVIGNREYLMEEENSTFLMVTATMVCLKMD